MKRAFSLVELMIVVAVLGILAAIVVPQFQAHSKQAREAVAKDSVRLLRGAIELYTAQHGGIPPGYEDHNPMNVPTNSQFLMQLITQGRYLSKMPENPFNGRSSVNVIGNNQQFPANATGQFGWVYQPATKTISLDWTGTDKNTIRYFDY